MDNVNKTLYIPLYGKALVSDKGIILQDKTAEEIWEKVQFPLKRKSKSKWLAYYMGMRSAVFDKWVKDKMLQNEGALVLHLGCGLDSRVLRVANTTHTWFDVDFQSVINERKHYYTETQLYRMLAGDIRDLSFIQALPDGKSVIVVLEGVSMYLSNEELQNVMDALGKKFAHLFVLMDCYTPFAIKMSKIKNPIKDVGVSKVYGIAHPKIVEENTGLSFVREYEITPKYLIDELHGFESFIFKTIYAGRISKKLYKLYEYES